MGGTGTANGQPYGGPDHKSAMWFGTLYVLFATSVVGFAVQRLCSVYDDLVRARKRRQVLHNMNDIEELLANDMSGDAKISNGEYLASFLEKMGAASTNETKEVLEAFDQLDVDGSGFLDANDLR